VLTPLTAATVTAVIAPEARTPFLHRNIIRFVIGLTGMRYYSGYSVIAGRELGKLSRASIAELPRSQEAGSGTESR